MTSFQDDVFINIEATINSEWVRNCGKDITHVLEEVEKLGVTEILFKRGSHVIVGSLDQLTRVHERLTDNAGKGKVSLIKNTSRQDGREDYADNAGHGHSGGHGDNFPARPDLELLRRDETVGKTKSAENKNSRGFDNDGGFDEELERGRGTTANYKGACELMVDNDIWEYIEEKVTEQLSDIKKLFAVNVDKTMDDSGILRIIITPKNIPGMLSGRRVAEDVKLMHESLVSLYQETFNSCVVETHEVHFSEEESELVLDYIAGKFPTVLAKRCIYNDNFLFIGRLHDAREARQQFQVLARRVKTGELRGRDVARSGNGRGNDVDFYPDEEMTRHYQYHHDSYDGMDRRGNNMYENDFDENTYRNDKWEGKEWVGLHSTAERLVDSKSEVERQTDKNYEDVDEAKNIKQDEKYEDEEEKVRNNQGTEEEKEKKEEEEEEDIEEKKEKVPIGNEEQYDLDFDLAENGKKLNSVHEFDDIDEIKSSSLVYKREASVKNNQSEDQINEDKKALCRETEASVAKDEELDVIVIKVKQEKLDSDAEVNKLACAAFEKIDWEDDQVLDLKMDAAVEVKKEKDDVVSNDKERCQMDDVEETMPSKEHENQLNLKHEDRSGGASGGSKITKIDANSITYRSLGVTSAVDDNDEEGAGKKNENESFSDSEKTAKSKRIGSGGGPKVTIVKKKFPVSSNTSEESLNEKKVNIVVAAKEDNRAAGVMDGEIGKIGLSTSIFGISSNCNRKEAAELRQKKTKMPFDSPPSSEDETQRSDKREEKGKHRLLPFKDDNDDESEMTDEKLIEKLLSQNDETSRKKLKELLDKSSTTHDPKKINNNDDDDDDDDEGHDDDDEKQPPDGTIVSIIDKTFHLAGYDKSGTIEIKIEFKADAQTGRRAYKALTLVAFLPASDDGRETLRLMKSAFNDRKLFTVQRNEGGDIIIVPNSISFKERPEQYPDPEYLPRLMEQLRVLADEML